MGKEEMGKGLEAMGGGVRGHRGSRTENRTL